MRAIPAILLAFLFQTSVSAQESELPTLTIQEEGQARRLELISIDLSVEARGELVEIVYELDFHNHSTRNTEGEFSIQLPEGATVSTYALEVKDAMRPAVSVEKEKALRAYESIKRRGVDPGIVERQEGNIYRTRIFPILGHQSKRVRIGYIRRLPQDGPLLIPLRHDKKVSFSLTLKGASLTSPVPGLSRPPDTEEKRDREFLSAIEFKPEIDLSVQSTSHAGKEPVVSVARAQDGTRYFAMQVRSTGDRVASAPRTWKRLRLIWDASHSGRWRDIDLEIAALAEFLKELGTVEVDLQMLKMTLSPSETFIVSEGSISELEKRLRRMRYDGAADFSQIEPSPTPTLLFSDGVASSPAWILDHTRLQENLHVLVSTDTAIDPSFYQAGALSHPIGRKNWLKSFRESTASRPVKGIPRSHWEEETKDGMLLITGHIPPHVTNGVAIHLAGEKPILIPNGDAAEEWNFVRRIRAQQRLALLEERGDSETIIEFAKAERLASDHTSLIVLEFFNDHIRFRIPPPEPELLEKYRNEIKRRYDSTTRSIQRRWENKVARHRTDFPWVDEALKSEAKTVSIWIRSAREVFPGDTCNEAELQPYEKWLSHARSVMDKKKDLKSRKQYENWIRELETEKEKLNAIRVLPPPPASDAPLHVSVRGFVRDKGIYSQEAPFHLGHAIREAGGPNHYGSLARVFVYRDAARTGFNLESSKYEPVPLQWGDMIVVESDKQKHNHWGAADPFSDPFMDMRVQAQGGAEKPAVFEKSGAKRASSSSNPGNFRDPFGGDDKKSVLTANAVFAVPQPPKGVDESVLEAFARGGPAEGVYEILLEGSFGKDSVSMATIIEVSRILFDAGERNLGKHCLSNLLEIQPNPIEAVRSYAYWLVELGETETALAVLREMTGLDLDPESLALLWQDICRHSGEDARWNNAVKYAFQTNYRESIATVLMTDQNGRMGTEEAFGADEKLPSDIRIVITSIGDGVTPRLVEPERTNAVSDSGLIYTYGNRLSEFLIKRAWPGEYRVSGLRWTQYSEPVTLHVQFYTNWAREGQSMISKTLLFEGRDFDLGTIEFSWGEEE
ncbi:MAG: VIT domain-containing protein [Verrucomicrobiales bacterium]|nr:VIT domain-containing protein [Verrucomicrobiales bacterium]